MTLLAASTVALAQQTPPPAPSADQSTTRPQITLGATVEQRNEAARALIPLLSDLKRRAQPGVEVKPGGNVPNSPFTGTQTTLFAFTVTRRSTPVDVRVVEAMDRLLQWEIGAPGTDEAGRLFDEWLGVLLAKNATAAAMQGEGPCDVGCVMRRMTTLDESWGASPRGRAETRDGVLLDSLSEAVVK